MRQRRIKNIDEKIAAYSEMTVADGAALKGKWRSIFGAPGDARLYLEIGCGKGMFINRSAARDPEGCYVAAEGLSSVVIRAMATAEANKTRNIRFYVGYVNDINSMFYDGELSGIFLNFSDPWPKVRHAKRRLTCGDRLEQYAKALDKGGFIRFKTDNDELFEFTLAQIGKVGKDAGLMISGVTRDLARSSFSAQSPETEYEMKFRARGRSINYVALTRV